MVDRHEWATKGIALAVVRQGLGEVLEVDWNGKGFEPDISSAQWSIALMREILRLAAENERLTTALDYEKTHHMNAREAWVERAEAAEREVDEAEEAIRQAHKEGSTCACSDRGKCMWHERAAVARAFARKEK